MNKEQILARLRSNALRVKDFFTRQYHSFANFLAEKKKEKQNNGCALFFSMRCAKYVFILMNLFYLVMSMFMIFLGTSSYIALKSFYDLLWLDVQGLCIIWMLSGVLLTCISVCGIIGAIKESVAWSNMYTLFLVITFFLQIITSIAAFALVATGSSTSHAYDLVQQLMHNYRDNSNSAGKMDYIQSTFQCCGGEFPSDWNKLGDYVDYGEKFDLTTSSYVTYALSTVQPKIQTPQSCCVGGSSYENNTCDNHYSKGCIPYVSEFISESLLIITSTLLVIGVVQILGMFGGLMLARMFGRVTTFRNVQKWRSRYEKVFDTPTYVDYRPLHNSTDALGDVTDALGNVNQI